LLSVSENVIFCSIILKVVHLFRTAEVHAEKRKHQVSLFVYYFHYFVICLKCVCCVEQRSHVWISHVPSHNHHQTVL